MVRERFHTSDLSHGQEGGCQHQLDWQSGGRTSGHSRSPRPPPYASEPGSSSLRPTETNSFPHHPSLLEKFCPWDRPLTPREILALNRFHALGIALVSGAPHLAPSSENQLLISPPALPSPLVVSSLIQHLCPGGRYLGSPRPPPLRGYT